MFFYDNYWYYKKRLAMCMFCFFIGLCFVCPILWPLWIFFAIIMLFESASKKQSQSCYSEQRLLKKIVV